MPFTLANLPKAYDKARADALFEDFCNSDLVSESETKGACGNAAQKLIHALGGNSPYLSRCMAKDWRLIAALASKDATSVFQQELNRLKSGAKDVSSVDKLMKLLREAKARIALVIAAGDVSGHWSLEETTMALSDFADLCLQISLGHIIQSYITRGEIETGDGLFILAMGKLGSRELNYSSDIDLIALFDEETARYCGKKSLSDCMIHIVQDLVKIIDARTADGYVFRTDLRLRPDPGATPIALSVGAAETYYQSIALNWERAAMIKARIVAGDMDAGKSYLERLSPFIWRRSMDFAAIEDIHSIKNQIHRFHRHGPFELAGYDVKLGPGGIREIEFFAQIHQLIAGGREPELRQRATTNALKCLHSAGRIDEKTSATLGDAYIFLRTLEHRLQMVNDAQTHRLPSNTADLERIACFMNYANTKELEDQLRKHIEAVQKIYDGLLPGNGESAHGISTDALQEKLESLGYVAPQSMLSIIERWQRGRYRALRTTRAQKLLAASLPHLLEAFSKNAEPDKALARFDGFLSKLPAGVQLFALFQSNPSLFSLIGRIMGIAPALAQRLAKRPQLIDALLDPDFYTPLPGKDTLIQEFKAQLTRARDYQDVLDLTRCWVDERKFQLGVHALESISSTREVAESMTDLAEVAITGLMPHMLHEYEIRHGPYEGGALCIIAMGKFGGRELSFGSDLDIVLTYAIGEKGNRPSQQSMSPARYFSGLGQGLLTAITALTAEGRLWEVDTRLRPSGGSGPLVVTVKTFEDYYKKSAWTWEHMALTRARILAAPDKVKTRVRQAILSTLCTKRDPQALLEAVYDMRNRLRKEYGTDNVWNIKYVDGGLIDLEFIVQYLLLREGHKHPEIFHPRLDDCIDALQSCSLLDEESCVAMKEAHAFFHAVQTILRLTIIGEAHEQAFATELKTVLAKTAGVDSFDELTKSLKRHLRLVRNIYAHVISIPHKNASKTHGSGDA